MEVPAGLAEDALLQALAPLSQAPVLHFKGIGHVFGGFRSESRRAAFEEWIDKVCVVRL